MLPRTSICENRYNIVNWYMCQSEAVCLFKVNQHEVMGTGTWKLCMTTGLQACVTQLMTLCDELAL